MTTDRPELTDAERESLEGILAHKTAKEIARDLDISHHAVEKRLKRAREKLGVTTSLEAARAYKEGYGMTASKDSDLPAGGHERQLPPIAAPNGHRLFTIGGTSLMFTSILLFAALSGAGSAPEALDGFDLLDRDKSGYIEVAEFSATVSSAKASRIRMEDGVPTDARPITAEEALGAITQLFDRLDQDGDERISRAEYDAKGDTGNVRIISVDRLK